MAVRGRGTLEIRESKDPFHVTTNVAYGMNLTKRMRHFNAPEIYRVQFVKEGSAASCKFPFLYNKASNEIGKSIPLSGSKLSEVLGYEESGAELAREKSLGLHPKVVPPDSTERLYVMDKGGERFFVNAENYLKAYEHRPKTENPLYTTSNTEIGKKCPSMATVVTERRSRAQSFSNSFNNIKYRDQALNCYLTKSKVHKELDPHFI